MKKTKIVLDADVLIHFSKGELLSILPTIFPNYQYIILSSVFEELKGDVKSQVENQIQYLKNMSVVKFAPSGEILKEYSILLSTKGKGESACLAYCRFNHDVVGSSNIRDVEDYCAKYQITYLKTFDFLYFAIQSKIVTIDEAVEFRNKVVDKGSKLPSEKELREYKSEVLI